METQNEEYMTIEDFGNLQDAWLMQQAETEILF